MPVQEITASVQEQVLDALSFAEKTAVSATKRWTEAIEPYVGSLPFADQLPSATELVEASFGLARDMVQVSNELTNKVLEVAWPFGDSEAAPAPKPAAKTSTAKAGTKA